VKPGKGNDSWGIAKLKSELGQKPIVSNDIIDLKPLGVDVNNLDLYFPVNVRFISRISDLLPDLTLGPHKP
jgi:hypothetical protein